MKIFKRQSATLLKVLTCPNVLAPAAQTFPSEVMISVCDLPQAAATNFVSLGSPNADGRKHDGSSSLIYLVDEGVPRAPDVFRPKR